MYDWFVLFVCTVTEEPHQSQYFCLAQEEMRRWAEAKRLFVRGFYFCLPPSLSLPSEQSVSVATSHPSPLHPDWQMQCQTFWSRTHLPLLLHSPGQPSVNISWACQTATYVRTRKSGGGGREIRQDSKRGRLEWTGVGGWGKNGRRQYWVNIQYNTPLTGLGMWGRVWGVTVVSHEFQEHIHWRAVCMRWKEGEPAKLFTHW